MQFLQVLKFFCVLLCFSRSRAQQSVWERMAIDSVDADTGYPSDVVDYVYKKYYHEMFPERSLRSPNVPYYATDEHVHFYLSLVYIHLYPRFESFGRVLRIRYEE